MVALYTESKQKTIPRYIKVCGINMKKFEYLVKRTSFLFSGHHQEPDVQQRRKAEGQHGQHLLQAGPVRQGHQVLQDGSRSGIELIYTFI